MKNFFDFDYRLENPVSWMFNLNHLFVVIFFAIAFSALYFGLCAKSKKGIKITKLVLAGILLALEFGRITYRALDQSHLGGSINWWTAISFEICATSVWITVTTLILSCFVDENNKTLIVLKNILYGAVAVGAGLTFIVPTNIQGNRPVYHWVNAQSVTTHLLLVFVPFYLIKVKELSIRIKNMWMPALGFLGTLAIAVSASHISGDNFFISLHDNLFNRIIGGNGFPHPYQMFVIFAVGLLVGVLMYAGAAWVRKLKKTPIDKDEKKPLTIWSFIPYLTGIIAGLLVIWLPAILGADFKAPNFQDRALKSWSGILILLPFILEIGVIYWIDSKNKKLKK